jgi:hypothetical protein
MPYETHIVDMGKGIYKVGSGVVTSTELLANSLQRSIDLKQAGESPVKYGLIDFTAMTELQVSNETVMRLLEIDRQVSQFTRDCFVAVIAPESLAFGMARLWSGFTRDLGWESQVFRDAESAKAWLRKHLSGGDPEKCSPEEYPFLNSVPKTGT